MPRRPSPLRVVRQYATDLHACAEALLVVLAWQPPPAPAGAAAAAGEAEKVSAPHPRNAPASEGDTHA
jgi:hypothetical protein